jgi:predicted phage terminase large subunit-like protein
MTIHSPQFINSVFQNHFRPFNQKAFETLNPTKVFQDSLHLHAIANALTDRLNGGYLSRLIIAMPPRSLKSSTISVALPAFALGRDPTMRILVTSYGEVLAERLSWDSRRLITSPFFRSLYPQTQLVKESRLLLETSKGGMRLATTVGAATTGLGGDMIIVDDPLSAADANSKTERDRVNRYYDEVLSSRLDNPSEGHIFVVMQRLHEDDLAGHLLKLGTWDYLCLPAMMMEDTWISEDVGGPFFYPRGSLLQPTRWSHNFLEAKQREIGSAPFAAQYLQNPVPAGGNIIRRRWLCYCDLIPDRRGAELTISVDTATKTGSANDFSVATVWLKIGAKHVLIDVWRDKVDFPDLKRKILALLALYQADHVLIEDAGNGAALIQDLLKLGIPVIGRKAKDTKEARLSSVSDYFEAGLVALLRNAAWLAEFERELLGFPAVKYDDQVDSVSQYFGWVRDRPEPGKFEVFWP